MPQNAQDRLALARKQFEAAAEAEHENRVDALADLKFSYGEQWPEDLLKSRNGRPCLVINRIEPAIRQITNEQRQNRPSVQVSPVDSGADIETADVIEGLVRHIERNSGAAIADDTAFEYMVRMGWGYQRVVTRVVEDESNQQEIFIEAIPNPFAVYIDPAAKRADRSDMKYAFIVEDMPLDEYKRQFRRAAPAAADYQGIGNTVRTWLRQDTIRVAEHFYFDEDGTVKWELINGVEVLEEADWPGRWIPVIKVIGQELIIENKRILYGLTRNARDPQRMYNYWRSGMTEAIALAPKAPWVAAAGQVEEFYPEWRDSNTRPLAVLRYRPTDAAGHLVPPPQRQVVEPAIQAMSLAAAQAADDLKAVTSIHDAALGARSNETSGVAIRQRQRESDIGNFHFSDNLGRALLHRARMLIDLIPKIYDAPRVARIIGREDEVKTVGVFNSRIAGDGAAMPTGISRIYDLGVGRYDVAVTTGPSFATKRQEAAESMTQMVKAFPGLMQIAGDLLVSNMDWPGAQQLAKRLKKALPPEFQDEEQEDKPPIPPEAQQQIASLSKMVDNLTAALNEVTETLNTKKMELESKERIASLQEETKLTLAEMETQMKQAQIRMNAQIEAERLTSQEITQAVRGEIDGLKQKLDLMFSGALVGQSAESAEPAASGPQV